MPTYQYACTECGHAFEQVQAFTDDALTECPQCHGRLRKKFNAVGVVFKGSGFYRNDSRNSGGEGGSPEGSSGSTSDPKAGSTSEGTSGSKSDSGTGSSSDSKATPSTSSGSSSAKPAAPASSGTSGSAPQPKAT